DTVGVAKSPGVADQSAVALHFQSHARVQAEFSLELLVELVAHVGRGRAAARRAHVDAGNEEARGEVLLDVKPVVQTTVTVVDAEPEREDPYPSLLRVDLTP